jgi:NUDIX domain
VLTPEADKAGGWTTLAPAAFVAWRAACQNSHTWQNKRLLRPHMRDGPMCSGPFCAIWSRHALQTLSRLAHCRVACCAGFCEIGETLEQAVVRETREEAGVCTLPPHELTCCTQLLPADTAQAAVMTHSSSWKLSPVVRTTLQPNARV